MKNQSSSSLIPHPSSLVFQLPRGRTLAIPHPPGVMGILNITPDSFSDGGVHFDHPKAVHAALQMEEDGAAVVDIGGEATRPGGGGGGACGGDPPRVPRHPQRPPPVPDPPSPYPAPR